MRVRVLVWNVHGLRAGVGPVQAVIERENPDVLLLTEVGRTGFRLGRLARRLGLRVASGIRRWRRGVPNAVLVRPPWRIVAEGLVVLPRGGGSHRRGFVPAVLGRSGHRLTAAAFHLGLSGTERLEHVRLISGRVPALRQPVLLGGDLNEQPGEPAAAWLAERLWDAFEVAGEPPGETFPAEGPAARIDYLFVTEGVAVSGARVVPEVGGASDHLPLAVDLDLEPDVRPRSAR